MVLLTLGEVARAGYVARRLAWLFCVSPASLLPAIELSAMALNSTMICSGVELFRSVLVTVANLKKTSVPDKKYRDQRSASYWIRHVGRRKESAVPGNTPSPGSARIEEVKTSRGIRPVGCGSIIQERQSGRQQVLNLQIRRMSLRNRERDAVAHDFADREKILRGGRGFGC